MLPADLFAGGRVRRSWRIGTPRCPLRSTPEGFPRMYNTIPGKSRNAVSADEMIAGLLVALFCGGLRNGKLWRSSHRPTAARRWRCLWHPRVAPCCPGRLSAGTVPPLSVRHIERLMPAKHLPFGSIIFAALLVLSVPCEAQAGSSSGPGLAQDLEPAAAGSRSSPHTYCFSSVYVTVCPFSTSLSVTFRVLPSLAVAR